MAGEKKLKNAVDSMGALIAMDTVSIQESLLMAKTYLSVPLISGLAEVKIR